MDISDPLEILVQHDTMALLPDLDIKNEELFLHFLSQPGVFAKLQGIASTSDSVTVLAFSKL
jgi:hypothetical protein